MTRAELHAFNAGIAAVVQIAAASAHAMRVRLVEKPTRFNFAVEALDALAEAGASLALPISPDEPESPVSVVRPPSPRPVAPTQAEAL